jgi:hypothetical protein
MRIYKYERVCWTMATLCVCMCMCITSMKGPAGPWRPSVGVCVCIVYYVYYKYERVCWTMATLCVCIVYVYYKYERVCCSSS